ncbi:MAG: nucleotidyltransferase domain-containing protein [Sedimentisphaerales bacterium]|nr:nucleotidyltransferase domain-containing protein [Sedimentisphaerales bacterium]
MALNTKESLALKQFKISLEHVLGNRLIEMKLFGSKARSDDGPDSDIDVLIIVATDDWHIRDEVYDIATDALLQMDVCISPKVISKNKLNQLHHEGASFIYNVNKDAITL